MNIEEIQRICLSKNGTSHEIKWDDDLCFLVAKKLFCVAWLGDDFKVSFKVDDTEFDALCEKQFIIPAPYMARAKWIQVSNAAVFSEAEWAERLERSYQLVKSKLSKKLQLEIDSSQS